MLVAEAKTQRVSLNSLVSRVLEDYGVYGRHAKRAKILRFSPLIVATLLNEFSDEVIKKIGKKVGQNQPREILAAVGLPDFTLENVVRLMEYYLPEHAGWFEPWEISREPDVWTIHLSQGINRKWSLFLCEYVTAMFQTLKFHEIEKIVEEYSITIRMRPPSTT